MMKWSEYLQVPYSRIRTRINTFKWSVEKAFEMKKTEKINTVRLTYNNESLTIKEWSDRTGICTETLNNRFRKLHWSIERTLTTPVIK